MLTVFVRVCECVYACEKERECKRVSARAQLCVASCVFVSVNE